MNVIGDSMDQVVEDVGDEAASVLEQGGGEADLRLRVKSL